MKKITVDLARDPYALNKIMEFDHVIRVHDDGTVSDGIPGEYAPELHVDDGNDIFDDGGAGWTLMTGYTGQHMYSGPVMHASEFIGCKLAEDILTTPGLYVAIVASALDNEEAAGWAVARKAAS